MNEETKQQLIWAITITICVTVMSICAAYYNSVVSKSMFENGYIEEMSPRGGILWVKGK
jgi:hypothetical protein